MALSKSQILASVGALPREKVMTPEWGTDLPVDERFVFVGVMTGTQRDAWEASLLTDEGTPTVENMRAKLAAFSIVDDQGNALFSLEEVEELGRLSSVALKRVGDVSRRLNKLSNTEAEALQGN